MYLDSAYIIKFYVNEHDAPRVRRAIESADSLVSSAWAIAEVATGLHRKVREREITEDHYRDVLLGFQEHVEAGLWSLIPVTERLLHKMTRTMLNLPGTAFLRAGDALHLTTAADAGEEEIWTSDRHLLAAAPFFGLTGRSA